MRVIGGEFRSRRLKAPSGDATRPTPDRLREALFNVLQSRVDGCVFVDAHAGSGAVGIEALSRGARQAVFIERAKPAVAVIQDNLRSMKLDGRSRVIQGSASLYLAEMVADVVFIDPPYARMEEYEACMRVAPRRALLVAQHASKMALPEMYAGWKRTRVLRQGDNSLSFYTARFDTAVTGEPEPAVAPLDVVAEQPGEPDSSTEEVS
jgi:16S rRNA (guanine966-N2)-methyltransferase